MTRPNFLIIVADDLGFSDLGCFGSEINTPNLDRLAESGVRFTDFHTASACSPTRAMLLSGVDHHKSGLGQMNEFANRAKPNIWKDKEGYEGVLNNRVAAISEILNQKENNESDKGIYKTILSGKWHLGLEKPYLPSNRSFERTFCVLNGAANHFKYTPDLGDRICPATRTLWEENGKLFNMNDLPDDFYSTDAFADKLIEFLDEDDDKERPFFSLLTFTAPHWPLQAKRELINKYHGVYDQGPIELRNKRLERLKKLGLVSNDIEAHPMVNLFGSNTWNELSTEERQISSRNMEVYAAMVESIDINVGKVINYLKEKNKFEDTIILFMSDNGAEGALLEALPIMGENIKETINTSFNNSLDNIGNGDSFVWYGPEWAQAGTVPSRLTKAWAYEGGIRVPLIAFLDAISKTGTNKSFFLENGSIVHDFCTVMDIVPTILELAGIPHPGDNFQGRNVHKLTGTSWVDWALNKTSTIHDDNSSTFGWELFGQQAIRKGNFKALFIPEPMGSNKWELYNLKNDPAETRDLSQSHPHILSDLVYHWSIYEAETGMVKATPELLKNYAGYIPVK